MVYPQLASAALHCRVNHLIASLLSTATADKDTLDAVGRHFLRGQEVRLYGLVVMMSLEPRSKQLENSNRKKLENSNQFDLRFDVRHPNAGGPCEHRMERCVASTRDGVYRDKNDNVDIALINDPCEPHGVRVYCKPVHEITGVPCTAAQHHIARYKNQKDRAYGIRPQPILFWCVHPFHLSIFPRTEHCLAEPEERWHMVKLGRALQYPEDDEERKEEDSDECKVPADPASEPYGVPPPSTEEPHDDDLKMEELPPISHAHIPSPRLFLYTPPSGDGISGDHFISGPHVPVQHFPSPTLYQRVQAATHAVVSAMQQLGDAMNNLQRAQRELQQLELEHGVMHAHEYQP